MSVVWRASRPKRHNSNMQQGLLPLFPLELVLLPGGQLPLHIFEERYKEMIGEARRDRSEFGIVYATPKGIADVGCTATIDSVLREYPDGRLDILTVARRRFEVLLVNQERSFLRASVEFFDDDRSAGEDDEMDLRSRAIHAFNDLQKLPGNPPLTPARAHDPQLSFHLAQSLGDLGFRQALLELRSETERLKQLIAFLPEFTACQRRFESLNYNAPRNGHGHLN